ncbi:MAG: hypothetical protein AB8C13_08655 [Phycisphaerales bacterium]
MTVFITLATAGITVLCLYTVYANVIRHETTLHDLRNRVEELQNQQAMHLAKLRGELPDIQPRKHNDGTESELALSDQIPGSDVVILDTIEDQERNESSSSTKAA